MKTHRFNSPARGGKIYRRYIKWSITSPLWFPAIFLLIGLFLDRAEIDLRSDLLEWIRIVPFFLTFSLVYGGLQYSITLMIVWKRIDFNNPESWTDRILMLPLILTTIQLVGVFLLAVGAGNITGAIPAMLLFAVFDLMIGYGYVLVWFLGLGIIQQFIDKRQDIIV